MGADRMLRLLVACVATWLLVLVRAEQPTLDFYMATQAKGVGVLPMQNINMASLAGATKYIQTELIAEHVIGNYERKERKYGIDTLVKTRVKVKNSAALLGTGALQVDFGPFVTYDLGKATTSQEWIKDYGGYVGVQMQADVRWPYAEPYFWYSLGGLCPSGVENLAVEPTGEPGCMYSYGDTAQVSLDELTGILEEDCGTHKCQDWLDFRRHCSNPSYRKRFDATTKSIIRFEYCVEYDVHPDCEASCNSPACLAVPAAERELGLPFWRGKCSPRENEVRVETIGNKFGVKVALTAHNTMGNLKPSETCMREGSVGCVPVVGQGGNYCSRQWAGVCSTCYIPGTKIRWPGTHMPYCPYNILQTRDYKEAFTPPHCKSNRPRDLCCMYLGSCSIRASSAHDAPLDDDGFALVVSWGNTSAVQTFLKRVAVARDIHLTTGQVSEKFAYAQWAAHPRKDANLGATVEEMFASGLALPPATTTATTTTATTTTATTTLTTKTHRDHDNRYHDNRHHDNRHHDKRHHDERKSTFAVQSDGGSTVVVVVVGCGVAASLLCMFAAAAFFFFGVKSKTPAQAMNPVKTKAAPHKMQDLEAAEESVGPNDSSASSVVAPPN